jgi:hypothetical protein
MAACHAWLGNDAQVAAAAAEVLRQKPNFGAAGFRGTLYYADPADFAHIHDGLITAGLPG